ncbi:MAG: polyprenyl synthetase family protein, partial [Planctomycetota bacterium]
MDLSQIKEMISPEMERVEMTLQDTLASESDTLKELIAHISHYSGKRLRPALVFVVSKALGKTTEDHVKLGAVIELIHTSSLIHDDILDEAAMRRGLPSVNQLQGNHVSVLLGDLVYARAFGLSLQLSTPLASQRLAIVTETICTGEIEQTFRRGTFQLPEAVYFSIIEAKTASLYGAACSLSAAYSDGSDEIVLAMEQYGLKLGIAFQIIDDCLDIMGEEKVVGKSLGTDAEKGKMTLPLLHLAASLPERDKERLHDIIQSDSNTSKNATIINTFDMQPSIDHAFKVAEKYIAEALGAADTLPA